jgi:hypothetical protein
MSAEYDILLPSQMSGVANHHFECEKRMVFAVLETAINDLKYKKTKRSVYDWLTDLSTEQIFSLRWVCDFLKVEEAERIAKAIRSGVKITLRRRSAPHAYPQMVEHRVKKRKRA